MTSISILLLLFIIVKLTMVETFTNNTNMTNNMDNIEVKGYDENVNLIKRQGVNYAPLDPGDFAQIYPGSINAVNKPIYYGPNTWIESFNAGLKLYDLNQAYNHGSDISEKNMAPKYPATISTTGLFTNTMPRAYNI